ncbi:MAG: hypothetical protein ACRDGS_08860, partial [Chloroflexota bacterium]
VATVVVGHGGAQVRVALARGVGVPVGGREVAVGTVEAVELAVTGAVELGTRVGHGLGTAATVGLGLGVGVGLDPWRAATTATTTSRMTAAAPMRAIVRLDISRSILSPAES